MSKLTKVEIDAITGELVIRDYNDAELAQHELDLQEYKKQVEQEKATATAKAALLTKLGITADEAALLLA